MRGIARPCRHTLGPKLRKQWMSHLCGVCLTIRDEAGQTARLLTGYDLLLLSVLVEAQAGPSATETAGPCALRGMRRIEVLPPTSAASRYAAAGSLLAGSAALQDKVHDVDLPTVIHPLAQRSSAHVGRAGAVLAEEAQMDASTLLANWRAAADVEQRAGESGVSLDDLLAPSGRAAAELVAHTAVLAGRPSNQVPLQVIGDSFGRLVHLLDAVDDIHRDCRKGAFNPLIATQTPATEARLLADELVATIASNLDEVEMVDPSLARALLGPVLQKSVARHFGDTASCSHQPSPPDGSAAAGGSARPRIASATGDSERRSGVSPVAVALVAPALVAGIFGGGRRRRPYYYDDPNMPPGYGYGPRGYRSYRRGPSCCDLLACDCCANMACNDCCGGGDVCCCCCD